MCFIKKSISVDSTPIIQQQQTIDRKKADASLTKTSMINSQGNISQNIKTSPYGMQGTIETNRKTLLGE